MFALHFRREVSVVDAVHRAGLEYHLTDREQEALIGVAKGLTGKELASRMNISPNAVKAFLRLIMVKMGVTTRAGIVGTLVERNGRTPEVQRFPRYRSKLEQSPGLNGVQEQLSADVHSSACG
jgi:DNA-binding CsgD family transcriptional regulator